MDREPTYGTLFVGHLTKLGRHVPYNFNELQQVKAMSHAELADWIKTECREFSEVIRDNPADVAGASVCVKKVPAAMWLKTPALVGKIAAVVGE